MNNKKLWLIATFDTKADEAFYLSDLLKRYHLPVVLVDLSTSQKIQAEVDMTAKQVASFYPSGAQDVFTTDRGRSIAAMTEAFRRLVQMRQDEIGGMLGIGGSGGTALITAGMQCLPIGVPKIMVSTVASGSVAGYVGSTDITMMHSVTDIAGLNRLSRRILANAAGAMMGAFHQYIDPIKTVDDRPALGLSMFGVTTPCVSAIRQMLENNYDCLVFHATGTGGRAMEKLLDQGLLAGLLDMTTTEIADYLFGGILACDADRLGAVIRTKKPYVGACGALDMINFGAFDTVPEHYHHRMFYQHNAQITLMRTTVEENIKMGEWIAQRLNQCDGEVRFLIPEGGFSALDAPGQPFWQPDANAALCHALETHLHQTSKRRLIRTPYHINDPAFVELVTAQFLETIREKNDATI